eukprot:scaffold5688_cov104-Cylindrotheca_fusiformis.AAC.14
MDMPWLTKGLSIELVGGNPTLTYLDKVVQALFSVKHDCRGFVPEAIVQLIDAMDPTHSQISSIRLFGSASQSYIHDSEDN